MDMADMIAGIVPAVDDEEDNALLMGEDDEGGAGGSGQREREPAIRVSMPVLADGVLYSPFAAFDAIIANIRKCDREGFFYYPVTEEVAPGYFSVIQRPMCLQMIEEKVSQREVRGPLHVWMVTCLTLFLVVRVFSCVY